MLEAGLFFRFLDRMVYTIGRTELYEITFEESTDQNPPTKIDLKTEAGVNEDYKGGVVWKTKKEAQKAAEEKQEDYSVYGVLADWNVDVKEIEGKNRLLRDSELIKL